MSIEGQLEREREGERERERGNWHRPIDRWMPSGRSMAFLETLLYLSLYILSELKRVPSCALAEVFQLRLEGTIREIGDGRHFSRGVFFFFFFFFCRQRKRVEKNEERWLTKLACLFFETKERRKKKQLSFNNTNDDDAVLRRHCLFSRSARVSSSSSRC